MRRLAMISGLLAVICLTPPAMCQQNRTWWAAGEFGEGEFKLHSDQVDSKRDPAFAMGFVAGHRLGNRTRAGLHVNGWLLETFDINDPMVGQSLTNVMGVMDAFPFQEWNRFFVRGGLGLSIYADNRNTGAGGKGLAWEAGAGYEIPLSEQIFLAPTVAYSQGYLNDVHSRVGPATGRRFSVAEFKIAVVYHFGLRRE